jgi:hypothetical protein
MKTVSAILMFAMTFGSAFADFALAQNGKKMVCHSEDNAEFVLNAERTTIKFSVEGESQGPKKIRQKKYETEEGILTLSDQGDTWQPEGESEASPVDCK